MVKHVVVVSSVPELLQAKEADGYFLSASQLAWLLLGSHEEGLLAASEYAKFLAYLRHQTDKPLFADEQSGFGNPLNTYFTTKEFEYYGGNVLLVNDQKFPSKTAHPRADDLYAFAGRVKAAVDAHHPGDSEVWVKLDGYRQYGVKELQKHLALAEQLGASGALLNHVPDNVVAQLQTRLKLALLSAQGQPKSPQVKYLFD